VGVVGFLLFGIAMQLDWVAKSLEVLSLAWAPTPGCIVPLGGWWSGGWGPVTRLETNVLFLTGLGVSLGGCSFAAYRRILGPEFLDVITGASLFSAWWLFIANLLEYTGLVWVPGIVHYSFTYWMRGPFYGQYVALRIFGLAMLGLTLLLWAVGVLATRHLYRRRYEAIAAAVLFVMAGLVLLLPLPAVAAAILDISSSIFLSSGYVIAVFFAGACLVAPACVLNFTLMRELESPK